MPASSEIGVSMLCLLKRLLYYKPTNIIRYYDTNKHLSSLMGVGDGGDQKRAYIILAITVHPWNHRIIVLESPTNDVYKYIVRHEET